MMRFVGKETNIKGISNNFQNNLPDSNKMMKIITSQLVGSNFKQSNRKSIYQKIMKYNGVEHNNNKNLNKGLN